MDWLNFLAALRESLRVDIPESDYEKLVTLDGLFVYLEQRRGPISQYPAQLVRE